MRTLEIAGHKIFMDGNVPTGIETPEGQLIIQGRTVRTARRERVQDCAGDRRIPAQSGLTVERLERLNTDSPRTAAEANRREWDALAELNRKLAEFWKGRVQ